MSASTWSKTWPTEPGWHWTRRRGETEPGRVCIGGLAGPSRVYVVAGALVYQSEQPELEWGHRIQEPGREPVVLSLSYGDACFAESALRRHAGQEHRPKYAKWCNRLADMLAEQCSEIVRVSEGRREEPDQ